MKKIHYLNFLIFNQKCEIFIVALKQSFGQIQSVTFVSSHFFVKLYLQKQ